MLTKNIERFKAGVYKISSLKTNEFYIGGSCNIYNRKHTHLSKLKSKVHQSKSLQKLYDEFGADNLIFEVLEYCDNYNEKESEYIKLLNPNLNVRKEDNLSNKGVSPSDEAKVKISNTLKEAYKNGLKGYKQEHAWNRVEQYDLEGNYIKTFNNGREAEKEIGAKPGAHSEFCSINRKTAYGFQWKIEGSDKIIGKYEKETTKIVLINIKTNEVKIFSSIKNCTEYLNCNKSTIFKKLKDKSLYKETYKIEYHDLFKQGELLENLVIDNQQPSISSNTFEGSTTNSRILPSNVEDSNANTSALHLKI